MTIRIRQLPSHLARYDGEQSRLHQQHRLPMLEGLSDEVFDRFTSLLSSALRMPIALVSVVDRDKVWFKSSRAEIVAVQRDLSLRAQAIAGDDVVVVEDAVSDSRFCSHPAVLDKRGVRFYAGTTLRSPTGQAVGTCCIMDHTPHRLSAAEIDVLRHVGDLIEHELRDRDTINRLRDVLEGHALIDPVNGLPSLPLFQHRADEILAASPADEHVIAAIRLQRYDALDSAVGRTGAAQVVGEMANRIRRLGGSESHVGQIREDEIAAVLPKRGRDAARLLIELLQTLRRPLLLGAESFTISARIGASISPRDGHRTSELLRRARIALRSEESSDESGCRLYSPRLSLQTDEGFKLEAAVMRCIEHGAIAMEYQPSVSLSTRMMTGAEALLRLRDDELGEIAPTVAVPLAERAGLGNELGRIVVASVVEQLSKWTALDPRLVFSINITGTQLRDPGFPGALLAALRRHGVAANRINLEITEGSLIADMEHAISVMAELRGYGLSFSIDDFGTGFSSLSYLRRMPLSVLKIDRSFVQHTTHKKHDATIAASLIALGHGLGLKVVAEGVETAAQLEFLTERGCDEVQGYVFGKALPPDQFAELAAQKLRFSLPSRQHKPLS